MSAMKVVGVRVDPWAKDDPAAATSRAEFRVIMQPVIWAADRFHPDGPKSGRTEDAALHLIYEVAPADVPELVGDLLELKDLAAGRTDGKPLSVHPVLADEGPTGPYATKLRAMIARFAVRSQLRVATHVMTENQDHWTFDKTEAGPDGLHRVDLPFVTQPREPMSQVFFTTGDSHLQVQDASSAKDNVNELVDDLPDGPFFSLPSDRQAQLVETGLRIDNPLVNGPGTVDCVSCHAATRALWRARGQAFLDKADGDVNRFPVPAGVTGRYAVDGLGNNSWSTRAFGYFDDAASVSMGAVNGSALVADALNRALAAGTLQP